MVFNILMFLNLNSFCYVEFFIKTQKESFYDHYQLKIKYNILFNQKLSKKIIISYNCYN